MRIAIRVSVYCMLLVLSPFVLHSQIKSKAEVRTMVPVKTGKIVANQDTSCCFESHWNSNTISWNNSPKLNTAAANLRVNANAQAINQSSSANLKGSINVKCDSIYHFTEGVKLSFYAAYTCVRSDKCLSVVQFSVSGPVVSNATFNSSTPNPKEIEFSQPGTYTLRNIAYCGDVVCNECSYTIVIDKKCCPSTKISPSTITTRIRAGIAPKTNELKMPPPLNTYSSATNAIVTLNYSCIAGCNPTYTYTRAHKNASGNYIIDPNGGGSGASPLTIPVPTSGEDRIVISMKCGNQSCGSAIEIFNLTCAMCQELTASANVNPNLLNLSHLPNCGSCDKEGNLTIGGDYSGATLGPLCPFMTDFIQFQTAGISFPAPVKYCAIEDYFTIGSYMSGGSGTIIGTSGSTPTRDPFFCISPSASQNDNSLLSGKTIWKNKVVIATTLNHKYTLCFNTFNVYNAIGQSNVISPGFLVGNPQLEIEVYINGTLLTTVTPLTGGTPYLSTRWRNHKTTWTANSSSAVIQLKFKDKAYPSNSDWVFGLDDIVFKECQ